MTDQHPLTDDDLSFALDGQADAEVVARIEADPQARARLDELRAAAATVRQASVPPLADEVVDDLIATAIDTPVAPASIRVRRGQRRATPWLVAASVVILMAIGLSLVWAGRNDGDDQAGATRATTEEAAEEASGAADSSFSRGGEPTSDQGTSDPVAGAHGAPTTTAATATTETKVPLLYLGTFDDGDALRSATAASLADAWKASGSKLSYTDPTASASEEASPTGGDVPSAASVDRCADQLRVTLSMKTAPIQTGYAQVDSKRVLVYEFATTSSADARWETTLVAAVGADACDEVVIFER